MEYLTVLAPRSLYETVLGGYMASGPGSQLSTVFCLLLWQTAIGETPQKTLVVGSNIALVAWLRCVELSQGEFGSGPARCGLDAILKVKYERRAASSTDSTPAPLRPGSLCKTAHNSSGSAGERLLSSGDRSRFAVPVGSQKRRRWPDAETGRNGSIARAAAARGPFWCFCLRGTGNQDKVLTV